MTEGKNPLAIGPDVRSSRPIKLYVGRLPIRANIPRVPVCLPRWVFRLFPLT
jgi:hypothetical protein